MKGELMHYYEPIRVKRFLFLAVVIVSALVGEVMCVVKCVTSDWKPPYKREFIYGVSAVTGFGMIVGYIEIPDGEKQEKK